MNFHSGLVPSLARSAFDAQTKFVPLSHLITSGIFQRLAKMVSAARQSGPFMDSRISTCIARVVRQVKIIAYLNCLRYALVIVMGPKQSIPVLANGRHPNDTRSRGRAAISGATGLALLTAQLWQPLVTWLSRLLTRGITCELLVVKLYNTPGDQMAAG